MDHATGSTLVLVDCYGCNESIANNPNVLHMIMKEIIRDAGLTIRQKSLDCWESTSKGASTSYHTLQESHVRASAQSQAILPAQFARVETWVEPEHGMHVNADFQVCNYSKDNSELPRRMAEMLTRRLGAREYQFMVIERGPGRPMRVIEGPVSSAYQEAAA